MYYGKDDGLKLMLTSFGTTVTIEQDTSDITMDGLLDLFNDLVVACGYTDASFDDSILRYAFDIEHSRSNWNADVPENPPSNEELEYDRIRAANAALLDLEESGEL